MAVVFSEDRHKVLLLRRELPWLWDLPGGGVERGEDPAVAAVRETREETGYEIVVERLVGTYLHQSVYGRGDQLTRAYAGHVVGGTPRPLGLETLGLRWCAVEALPGLERLQESMIADAVAAHPAPVERRVDFAVWKLIPARILFFLMRWRNEFLKVVLRRIRRWNQVKR